MSSDRRRPRRRRPLGRRLALAAATLCLLAMVALALLVFTTSGARWLGRRVQRREPRLGLQIADGSLWRGLQLRDVTWEDHEWNVSISLLDLHWRISPAARPTLHIDRMHVEDLGVAVENPLPKDADVRAEVSLPEIRIPLDLRVSGVRVLRATVVFGGTSHQIHSLQGSADLVGQTLTVHSLVAVHEKGEVGVEGSVRLADDYPLLLSLRGHSPTLLEPYSLDLSASLQNTLLDPALDVRLTAIHQSAESGFLKTAGIHLTGSRSQHRATFVGQGGAGSFSLELSGCLGEKEHAWSGTLDGGLLSAAGFAWKLDRSSPALRWNPEESELVIDPHRWVHANAELRMTEPLRLGASGSAAIRLSGLDLVEFQRWIPDALRIRGTLAAAAEVRWADRILSQAHATLELHDAGVRLAETEVLFLDDAPPLDVALETVTLQSRITGSDLVTHFELVAPNLGNIRAGVTVPVSPHLRGQDFAGSSGEFRAESLNLGILQPFLPELRTLKGEISADLLLTGDPRRPHLQGSVSLTNAVIEPAGFPVTIGDLALHATLDGHKARWKGEFRSGEGVAALEGETSLHGDTWEAGFHLVGDRLELAYGTLAVLQASPDLHLNLAPGKAALTGVVTIPQASITIRQLPESAVRPSGDVVFLEDDHGGAPPPPSAAAVQDTPVWSQSIDLELRLGERVALGGYGITGRLAGDLRFQQIDQGAPSAFGELRIEDGRYRAYGQRLQIRRGRLLFSGPVDRFNLYVEAIRDAPAHQVVAGLRVEGRPDALESSLFSEPILPEEEILAFLLLGRPLVRGEESDSNIMLTRAAIGLGIAGGGDTASAMAERLGIEELQLDTAGEGDETQVVVSGRVTPRLQLSYSSGVFVPANTLTLRYRLVRQLYLETVTGVENALDLLYTFSF